MVRQYVCETFPLEAMQLFKKVININPEFERAYNGIIVTAGKTNRFDDAYNIFSELITEYPQNINLIYLRACVLGISGDNLKALLESYKFIELAGFYNNPELFLKHQVFNDIAFGKCEL